MQATQTVRVQLPGLLYEQVQARTQRLPRSVERGVVDLTCLSLWLRQLVLPLASHKGDG